MSGRQVIRIQGKRMAQQPVKANTSIAFETGIGRKTGAVLVDEVLHDAVAKHVLGIQHVKWNAEPIRDAPRALHLIGRAAAIMFGAA